MGKSAASSACTRALMWCDTALVVCLGIAGGISSDVKLGDVVYTGRVIDVYDNSKAVDKDGENYDLALSPKAYETNRDVAIRCNFVRSMPSLQPALAAFKTATASFVRSTGVKRYTGRNGKKEEVGATRFLPGCLICGVVSKSVIYNKQLQDIDRRILAIETESGGVFEAASVFGRDVLCIRGISDYADGDKKKLEEETKGKIRELAAFNAASFFALQKRNASIQQLLLGRRRASTGQASSLQIEPDLQDISDVLTRVGNFLDEYLRGLSPLYRAQPSGYRLPVPRVRMRRGTESARSTPLEVRDILERRDRIIVSLPKMFPDAGLPCVIAQDLIKTSLASKQPVPILIDAQSLSPPQKLMNLLPERLDALASIDGAMPIIIVANPPLESRIRTNAFIKELNELSGVKMVIVANERVLDSLDVSLADAIGAEQVSLERVSFREMAFSCREILVCQQVSQK